MPETYNGAYVNRFRAALASTTVTSTASSPGDAFYMPAPESGGLAILDVTAAATGDALDKLDVYLQTKVGSDWYDAIHFTQIDGDSGAVTYVSKIQTDAILDQDTGAAEIETGTALPEGKTRRIFGDAWRVRWVVTDGAGAGTHSFTFSVEAATF
jgi:hypothetical protein